MYGEEIPHTAATRLSVPETTSEVQPLILDSGFRQLMLGDWRGAFRHARFRTVLQNYCAFCGRWLAMKGPSVKQHVRLTHPDLWPLKAVLSAITRTRLRAPSLFQASLARQVLLKNGSGFPGSRSRGGAKVGSFGGGRARWGLEGRILKAAGMLR